MLLQISNAKLSPLVLSLLVLLVSINVSAQNETRARKIETPLNSKVKLAVLPFRNALVHQTARDAEEVAALGEGIADSLTNALKTIQGINVIDSEIVLRAAARFPGTEISVKDEDAIQVGESLSAQIIIVGSFQLVRDHLHVDARLLTLGANRPASKLVADCMYPDKYSAMVTQLITTILPRLKIPLAQLKTAAAQSELNGVHSREVLKWYNQGIQQANIGTEESLGRAIEFFGKALSIEPDFPQALAERSKAERRLYAIRRDETLLQAARNDASRAVSRAPNLGRGYGALAGAQRIAGETASALQSEKNARSMSPGDTGSLIDLTRAQEQGKLVRNAYTDRLFAANPELSLLFPQLPKVLVKNSTDYAFTVMVIPDGGQAYPTTRVPANSSRIIAVFPGHCKLVVESELGRLEDKAEFREGIDQDYEISGTSFPVGTFVLVNEGNCPINVRITGVRSKSLVLQAGEKTSVTMAPGSYSITARLQTAMTSSEHELRVGQEETIPYRTSCGRYAMFDPARLVIDNDGNAPFRATIIGTRTYSVTVPVGGTSTTLPAGSYRMRFTCGNKVLDAGEYELSGDTETRIERQGCIIKRYIYR